MKKNLKLIVIIASILLLFILITIFSFLSKRIPENPLGTVGNTAGNLNNRGLFCEQNGIVYFSNPYDNGSLYSMDVNESKLKKLGSAPVELINVGGNLLYYFQTSARGEAGLGYVRAHNGIFRSNLNGKDTVSFSSDPAYTMQLVDNYLYYVTSDDNGPHFYKKRIDRSDLQLLSNTSTNPACARDSMIYFCGTKDDHHLYCLNTTNDSVSMVFEGNLWNPILAGDYIYYMDLDTNYNLARYCFSTDTSEILTTDRVDTFNLSGESIFYQKNSSSNPCLIRMNLDGSNSEVIMDGVYSEINVTSQYAYFHPFQSPVPLYRVPVSGPYKAEECQNIIKETLKLTN